VNDTATHDRPRGPAYEKPRKAVIGTCIFGPYGRFTSLSDRLSELGEIVDEMAADAERRYPGAGLDLAVFPEEAVDGGKQGTARERALPLSGEVLDRMGAKAREHGTYIVLPILQEERGIVSNTAVLLDRDGNAAGTYRKRHPVLIPDGTLEGGVTPGTEFPVFRCDFGTIGFQICFDIYSDDGWDALTAAGAELAAWPTQSPQTVYASMRALRNRIYVVSSTWRNNASIYEPTGMVLGRITDGERVLVREIDLSYLILPWSHKLAGGRYLTELYGDRVGYRYYESEDCGIFWSNDPETSIREMVERAGLDDIDRLLERNRAEQDRLRPASAKTV
jgi:predicted amidohydrolase